MTMVFSTLFQYYFNTILIQYFVPDLLFTYDSALKIEYDQIIPDKTSFGVHNSDAFFMIRRSQIRGPNLARKNLVHQTNVRCGMSRNRRFHHRCFKF